MLLTQNRHDVRVDNVLPSLIAVGPSANRATTERVMATSVILFMLTSMALRCVLPKGSRGGPVTVTLVSVHVTFVSWCANPHLGDVVHPPKPKG